MFFTQNPIGSSATEDLQDNAISFDYAMNSPAALWQDRFGKQHKTVQQALKDVGFKPAGFDFVSGGTLGIGDRDKCVFYPTNGYWYSWNGKLPYVIPANSSPTPGGKTGWGVLTRDDRVIAREALRRTYLEVGYNLVEGSFEQGGTLNNQNDALLQEHTGKAFSGPAGVVPAGTNPASGGFVDRSPLAAGAGTVRDGRFALRDFVSVCDFGADPSGTRDSTAAFLRAHGSIKQNESVYIPIGTYLVNLSGWTRGIYSHGATLKPFNNDAGYTLQLGYHNLTNTWDFTYIEGITIVGAPAASCVRMGTSSEFDGRYVFDNVTFVGGEIGVHKMKGNIGNRYYNCTWTGCAVGVWAEGSVGSVMHVGADAYFGCHFDKANKAAVYYKDQTDGIGQISFTDCIFEGNTGFAVLVRMTAKRTFSPPFSLINCWFESNAKLTTVNIDDLDSATPRDLRLDSVESAVAQGCYLSNIELRDGTKLRQSNCRADNSTGSLNIIKDNNSFILSDGIYSNNPAPLVNVFTTSILGVQTAGFSTAQQLSVRMPLRFVPTPKGSSKGISADLNSSTPVRFTGTKQVTTVPQEGGILGTHVHNLTISANTTALSPTTYSTTGDEYVMTSIHMRLVSGDPSKLAAYSGGGVGILGRFFFNPENPEDWACTVTCGQFNGVTGARAMFQNLGAEDITISISEFQIRSFNSEGAMLNYIHSGVYTRE